MNTIFETHIEPFIINALKEDIGDGDHTTLATISKNQQAESYLLAKSNGILAGITIAERIFNYVDPTLKFEALYTEGEQIKTGDTIFTVKGNAQSILTAERIVLNTLQRMSGIATITRSIVNQIKHTEAQILDTRKTTPGIRFLEKWAVKIGGGQNHRFGLFDMILIKDNHIDTTGGIEQALSKTKTYLEKNQKKLPIEIEVRNFDELNQVLTFGGVDRILLDNFTPTELIKAVEIIDNKFPSEASGNITPDNVLEYAQTGVKYISMGYLTHSVASLDLSLKIKIN